ncbi:MAG: hypothetical protein ACOCXM_10165 [Myxococcota bacterium]
MRTPRPRGITLILAGVVSGALGGCGGDEAGHPTLPPCNGAEDFCERSYNSVASACTHNAMSTEANDFHLPTPNQDRSILQQLDDGVRCLMLDTYMTDDGPALCHADCELGQIPWVPLLEEIDAWLDRHPEQVVTFILEAYISEAETEQALRDAGIFDRVYRHDQPPGSPWPTLRELIDADQRLVVFTDDGAANGDWHLDWRDYGWETPFNDDTFTCDPGRGDPTRYDDQVFILNHYTLCPAGGCESNAEANNAYDFLFPRAVECWRDDPARNPWGQIPTFVNVDHYHVPEPGQASELPDVFDAVAALNGAWPTPPAP